jgi:hypothetical protein
MPSSKGIAVLEDERKTFYELTYDKPLALWNWYRAHEEGNVIADIRSIKTLAEDDGYCKRPAGHG